MTPALLALVALPLALSWRPLWLAVLGALFTLAMAVAAKPFDHGAYARMMLQRYDALDKALVDAGHHPTTPWWREQVQRHYESRGRQSVFRVGRRAGKSSTLCRVAVCESLYGQHVVSLADLGVVAFISVSRDEANQRLRMVKAILDVLGVKYRPIEHGIELDGRPIAFKTFVATVAGVSGFTAILVVCDEVAKWRDADSGSNPATEVLRSVRPTMAGQPRAKIILSSSAMGKEDAHARAFDQGDTDFQIVARAETWVARPSLTEAMCRELEPDEDTFQREYGNRPFDGSTSSQFTDAGLMKVTRKGPAILPPDPEGIYVGFTDPAARGNAWTLCIARCLEEESGAVLVQVVCCREWKAPKGGALDSDAVFEDIAAELEAYGIFDLWQDQWSYDAHKAIAERHGIDLLQEVATQAGKVQAFEALRRRVNDLSVQLPDDAQVRADLCAVRKWISKNGAFSIELERVGSRHADYAPAIAGAVAKAGVGEAGWATAMRRILALEADGEAPDEVDDGERESELGPNVTLIKAKWDLKYCRRCRKFYVRRCPLHPGQEDDDE